MRILLIGQHAEALQAYQKMLAVFGIDAVTESEESPPGEHQTVAHLWPMSAHELSKRLQAIFSVAPQVPAE